MPAALDAATCAALGFRPDRIADLSRLGLSPASVAARQHFIGGSDATIIGNGDPKSVRRLCEVKRGIRPPDDLSREIYVQLGCWTEPFLLAWAERALGVTITRVGERVYHPRHPHLACTLDGWIDDWQGKSVAVQVKHVKAFSKPFDVADQYRFQLQHELAVTGADVALLVVMIGTLRFAVLEVEPDFDLWSALYEAERDFWAARLGGWHPAPTPISLRAASVRQVPLRKAATHQAEGR